MPNVFLIAGLFLVVFLLVDPSHAEDISSACPYPKGHKIEDIEAVLAAHEAWVNAGGMDNPDIPGHANFCNSNLQGENLHGADLRGANLRGANLQEVSLGGASLQEAYLDWANLRGAVLDKTNLQRAKLKGANLQRAYLSGVNLQEADLSEANLQKAILHKANLHGANLVGANLQGANLSGADLQKAFLQWANLQEAYLRGADFRNAYLHDGNLKQADLRKANLRGTGLERANLQGADLTEADLRDAHLNQSLLSNAILLRANIGGTLYQPATAPSFGSLSGLKGLSSVWFCPGESSGLVQLREAFKNAGLRDSERVATNTLERIRTDYALARWKGLKFDVETGCPELERGRFAAVEGVFRLVFFDWTTAYGLAYGRPILILLALIGVFSAVYLPALLMPPKGPVDSGIFRIFPKGRIKQEGTEAVTAGNEVVERLNPTILPALGLALYFSIVSAFHLGWRDLNVGTWIARLQAREYALRAKGWVRVASGVQSLISVYLLAMWVLTYFGRPFG